MRIDRRGNPAFRRFPDAKEVRDNLDLTGEAGMSGNSGDAVKDRPSVPSEAFGALENGSGGIMSGIATIFAAVGKALKDIKQGSSKTFD